MKLGSKGDQSLKMSGDGNDMWGEDEDDALLAMVDDVEQVLHLFYLCYKDINSLSPRLELSMKKPSLKMRRRTSL